MAALTLSLEGPNSGEASRRRWLKSLAKALALGSVGSSALPLQAIRERDRIGEEELDVIIGQLLLMGLPANSPDDKSAQLIADDLAAGRVSGTVLLRHNVADRESLLGLTRLFIEANPLVLNAVDQEGGLVQRLSSKVGFSKLPRASWVAANLSPEQARQLYFSAGEEMRSAGFNVNLAPSVDWHDDDNPVIGKHGRSFGNSIEQIETYARNFVMGMERAGLASTLKHFPGHGTSRGDSHNGFVNISQSWQDRELTPFQLLASQAQLVMGGHLFHPQFSDGELPITFSRWGLSEVLRKNLEFSGVIITDDLDMGAIRKNFSLEESVVRSLQAGNDLLLMSNSLDYDPELPKQVAIWVKQAVADGRLNARQLEASYFRVMRLKQRYGFHGKLTL